MIELMQTNIQDKYLKVQVETASPGELTHLLYQELVRTLMRARQMVIQKDYQISNELLHKGRSILFELMSTLDMKYDISKDLYALYEFYAKCIAEVIINHEIDMLDEVIDFAKGMYETWKQALQIVKGGSAE
ncbi:flagellar export chaperone FliS [Bifidobacterium pullorum subsp. gallinarum]|jgi:flagellar protein FliS|nr:MULTISPECIES: flagellar export chaperone FliS [Paenibacillus]